jgi:WD40 repeat protein
MVAAIFLATLAMLPVSLAWGQQKPPIEWINAGHNSGVAAVAFSPSGQMLFSGSSDTTVKLWWVDDGSLFQTLRGHAITVSGIAFSPDERHFATSGFDGAVRVRVLSQCEPELLLPVFGWVFGLAYSPDGSRLATVNRYGDVDLWNALEGTLIWNRIQDHDRFNTWAMSVAYSPDGTTVISGGQFPRIDVWDAETGTQLQSLAGHSLGVLSVAFSPDGQTFASGSGDRTIKLWQKDKPGNWSETLTLTGHGDAVNKVLFMPDGQTLLSSSVDRTNQVMGFVHGNRETDI